MFNKPVLTNLIFLIILICPALSAQSDSGHLEKPCKLSFSSMRGLPEMALRGTDLVNISLFKNSSQPRKNRYSAKMGGASLDLHIKIDEANKVIIRSFEEPGADKHIRQYPDVCIQNGLFSARGIKGKLVEGGLLLLEEEPGVDGIPSNLWIFYKRLDEI